MLRTAFFSALLIFSHTVFAEPFAYVSNAKSGSVSIIDTQTDEVVGEIKAAKKPRGAAISRDGKTLYVSDQPNNSIANFDLIVVSSTKCNTV